MNATETRDVIRAQLPYAVGGVNIPDLKGKGESGKPKFYQGKVRDTCELPNGRLEITTDRLSAFDHVLGPVPYKGEVLHAITQYFLKATEGVFPNALLKNLGQRAAVTRNLGVFPVEAIIRAYITGSAARDYFDGEQKLKSGVDLRNYLRENRRNEPFTELLFTPTTKATVGHDNDISEAEILERKLMTADQLEAMKNGSFAVFRYGAQLASERGLILVDTKFEFGVDAGGRIYLVDEVLTPDSSRYWLSESYAERYKQGKEPEGLSKEPTRQALIASVARRLGIDPKAIKTDNIPPELWRAAFTDDVRIETALDYLQLYEKMTGKELELSVGDPHPQLYRELKEAGIIKGYFVPVISGSPSDDEHVKKIRAELDKRGIPNEHRVCSAHKDPVRLVTEVLEDYKDSIEPVAIVTVAGMSDGLSGVVAANSPFPVIACPPPSERFGGSDIYSTLSMPSGVPAMTVLEPSNVGAEVQRIFGLVDEKLRSKAAIEIEENRRKGSGADTERRN